MKNFLCILTLLIFCQKVYSQEFRGLDIRLETIPGDPASSEKNIFLDLYFKSPDTVQMDSFLLICSWYDWVTKQEHLFFDNDIQLLRFFGTASFSDFTWHLCWTYDSIAVDNIVNYDNGNSTHIRFGTLYTNFNFNDDPIFNSLQTDVTIENGVVYFDAGGVDPDGQNLGYFFKNNFEIGTIEGLYQIPTGIELDSVTGELTWQPTEPGKYLLNIGYAQSFSPSPPNWSVTTKRYMIIEIKEEDIVSSLENKTRDKIEITPNPATSRLNIQIEQAKIKNAELRLSVSTLIGQLLYSETFPTTSNKIKKEINISDWPPGIYLLTLQTGEEIMTEKIVVY